MFSESDSWKAIYGQLSEIQTHLWSSEWQGNWATWFRLCCCCSVTKLCLTLYDPMNCSMPGSPSFTISWSLLQVIPIESVMPSNHLILCCPLLFLPSIFPSIRIFSSESALHLRWLEDWSFSFNISPSNGHLGLISFQVDWFDPT